MDGIPLLANSHVRGLRPASCGCGAYLAGPGGPSPRLHHFWACPVAQAEIDQLLITISRPIPRAEVWLAQTPEGVEQCVWDVVVLAAITAMEQDRRFIAATLARDPQETPRPSLLERANTRVMNE